MGPAGLITTTADDLLDFGRAFLRGGRGAAGEALLSEDSVRLMTSPQVTLVPAADAMAPQWGLGWMLDEWEGHRVYWHGGTTIGNNAWFQVLPDDGLAFVVFCNGGVAARAASEVFGGFAQTFAGVRPTSSVAPSGPASELEFDRRLLGTYADAGTTLDVFEDDAGRVQVRVSNVLEPAAELPPAMTLLPAGGMNRFTAREDSLSPWMQIAFTEVDGRECAYVGIRCLPRRVETDGAGTDAAASIAVSRDRGVA